MQFGISCIFSFLVMTGAYANQQQTLIQYGGLPTLSPPPLINTDNFEIALTCYQGCRKKKSTHAYCESLCKAEGVPGVKSFCYKMCSEEKLNSVYCNSACN